MKVCIYLRKSRADIESEKQGEFDTLSKHRKALLKHAKENNLNIIDIKEEVVSGESIFHRPKMIELLKEVESNMYDGVLVMDMQRLGRGDMQDQGMILKTFKDSNTRIITPSKTYDLANEFDEEYGEFEAFMSRKELKMITRRLQRGIKRTVEDGQYLSANPPYGYDIHIEGKIRTLKPNYDAKIVKMIFEMYVAEGIGCQEIAHRLNALGYRNGTFKRSTINAIIKNNVYNGKITWNKRKTRKSKSENKKWDVKTNDRSKWLISAGKHPAIIDDALFEKAQEIMNGRYHVPYNVGTNIGTNIVNPLAGLIICGICGYRMTMKKSKGRTHQIMCTHCYENKSSRYTEIEKAILDNLRNILSDISIKIDIKESNNIKVFEKQIGDLSRELSVLNTQKMNLFDLLEQGVYTKELFVQRSSILAARIDKILSAIDALNESIYIEKNRKDISSEIKTVLDGYEKADIPHKNQLLKLVIEKAVYTRGKTEKHFNLEITTRI